jgi:hypothetical protein
MNMGVPPSDTTETRQQRRLLAVTRLLIIVLGVLSAWTWRYTLNPDGISYIDVSGHYLAGNWPLSNSGYWSPLYPSLVAAARLVSGTAIGNAWTIAHVVNLFLFLGNIAAAEYFIRSVRAVTPRDDPGFPQRMFTWTVLVYLLVGWTSISWITLRLVTPDLAVSGLVYLAAGQSMRIVHKESRLYRWIALGATLGLAYLAKTVMLPIGVAIMGSVAIRTIRHAGKRRGVLAAFAMFVLVCLPQAVYVSLLNGAPTFGDVGRLTYGWYMAGVPTPLWDIGLGDLPASLPTPDGPTQEVRVLDATSDPHPMVYAVDGPFPATLPIWYDATYWYRNVRIPFAVKETLAAAARNTLGYARLFLLFLLAAFVALITSRQRTRTIGRARIESVLVLPALCALAVFAVSHWEPRFIAPFAVLLLSGLVLPAYSATRGDHLRNGFIFAGILLFITMAFATIAFFKDRARHERVHDQRMALARTLRERGLGNGTHVGFVGDPYTAYWAQLAGLRFVSVVPSQEAEYFWAADSLVRGAALQQMRSHGATVILARSPGVRPLPPDWIPVAPDSSIVLHAPQPRLDSVASNASRR